MSDDELRAMMERNAHRTLVLLVCFLIVGAMNAAGFVWNRARINAIEERLPASPRPAAQP